jgi:predicted kinase
MAYQLPHVPPPGTAIDWDRINQEYDWLLPMKKTPQDPVFHGEGNVWIHTYKTLEALTSDDRWRSLPKNDRAVLFWAALLHDIAKPICTRREPNGTILSPNHTLKGERLARKILWQGVPAPVPFAIREKIVKLVRYHGLPVWGLHQSKLEKKVIFASQMTNLKHLAILAEADICGRICSDAAELLERVELFRVYAKETGCYDRPYPFATDRARFTYMRKEDGHPTYVPYDDTWGTVILMSGLPGAGKDTWLAANAGELPFISLDAIRKELALSPNTKQGRVVQEAKAQAKELLRRQRPFVWNATNITQYIRKPLIDLFFSYGAKVKIVYVEPPYKQLLEQNRSRPGNVPQNVLYTLIDKLEVPGIVEADEILTVV